MSQPTSKEMSRGRFAFWLSCFLGDYQWFRKWYGGKWSLWLIDLKLTRNPLWLQSWERPGCGLWWYEREEWPTTTSRTPNEAASQ
jgi:hypothetical protein